MKAVSSYPRANSLQGSAKLGASAVPATGRHDGDRSPPRNVWLASAFHTPASDGESARVQSRPKTKTTGPVQNAPSICFVGLRNLPVLAREYGRLGAGGAELQQTLLARALAREGFSVSMVVADYGQPDGAVWDGIKTYKTFRPEEGIPGLRFLHPRWTKVWAAMERADADIYYTSCAGAIVGQVAMFARLRRRKFIFRIASNSDCDPASLLIRFWRDKQLYRYGLRRADRVLAQTPEQRAALLRNFGRHSHVAASLTGTPGTRRDLRSRDIDVLWVGNIRTLKRPELLLRLARELPELRFEMIGGPMPGSEALYESIEAQARAVPNLHFHGAVAYHAIGEFYERARVLAGTSEIEGFPNTYLQAWAHGTPVIAFLDPQELLSQHSLGSAVNTLDEMRSAVTALCTDAGLWEATSERCKRYMDARFDEAQMLAPYLEAIESLQTGSPDPCRSVLMVGTDPAGRGGIRTVVSGYLDAGLFDRFEGQYVVSHRKGGLWTKMIAALGGWLKVAWLLRRLDAPLVHVQCSSRASFWRKSVVCLLARLAGRPYILHIHSGEFIRFYEKSGRLAQRYIRGIFARAGTVIALSEQWRDRLRRISPSANIEILTNALVPPASEQVRPAANRDPVLLYLGDITRAKGVHDLTEAFARIAGELPQLQLVCGGLGSDAQVSELQRRPGVTGRISFPGWLGPEQKRAQLARAAVFVLPSYAEGMPMALLEAMSWGLPVVATAVGAIPELIADGKNGLLVAPGDVNGLASSLALLARDPALRERLGRAARACIEDTYTLESTLTRLGQIYRRYGIEPKRRKPA